jgi:hypothetical protein
LPLPLPLQFIIAMMAHAINERMARKLDEPRGAPAEGVARDAA